MTTATHNTSNADLGEILKSMVIWGLIAAVISLVIAFIATSVLDIPLEAPSPTDPEVIEPIALPMFGIMSFLPALVAGVLYWALDRFTANPWRWFMIIAGIVFVFFFIAPFAQVEDTSAIAVLELTHVVVAGAIIYGLSKFR